MTIEITTHDAGETSAAEEARNHRLNILKGLHGVWVEYPDDYTGEAIFRFELQDPDEA